MYYNGNFAVLTAPLDLQIWRNTKPTLVWRAIQENPDLNFCIALLGQYESGGLYFPV